MLLERAFPQFFLALLHLFSFMLIRGATEQPEEYVLWVALLVVLDVVYYCLIKARERIEHLERKVSEIEQDLYVRRSNAR